MPSIEYRGFTFRYSTPKKCNLASTSKFFSVITAPDHGLVMGSIIYFGVKEPSIETIEKKVKSEAKFHVRIGNVK